MGLNPSCDTVRGMAFPNLGDPPFDLGSYRVAALELRDAFPEIDIDWYVNGKRQHIVGYALGWRFRRNWYYWVARDCGANPVPRKIAYKFNRHWGSEVRVDGFSGGGDVSGPVEVYHVDTVAGFRALADLLRGLKGK